jgi:hypothetical protein
VNVPPVNQAPVYAVPVTRRIPPAETASDVSTVAAAAPRIPVQYVSKPDRDAVYDRTGQRIAAGEIPIPPIALQIAAERRAGVGTAHAYARAVVDTGKDTSRQTLRHEQSGLDVVA